MLSRCGKVSPVPLREDLLVEPPRAKRKSGMNKPTMGGNDNNICPDKNNNNNAFARLLVRCWGPHEFRYLSSQFLLLKCCVFNKCATTQRCVVGRVLESDLAITAVRDWSRQTETEIETENTFSLLDKITPSESKTTI